GLTLLIGRLILRPVGELVGGIRRLGGGQLDGRIATVTSHDEFGLLARHIDRMARRLSAQRRQLLAANEWLESVVAQRTASLL
ncbi:HAMP domain-containing protein, partial [Acinetobacter baumannii]